MKINLIRTPIVVGSLISGTLVIISLIEAFISNPRWDDHLLNAIGIFIGALFISFTLWLVTTVFRPQPNASQRSKFASIGWLLLFVLLIFVVFKIAMFIDNMSFL
jgi:hypothetical protein